MALTPEEIKALHFTIDITPEQTMALSAKYAAMKENDVLAVEKAIDGWMAQRQAGASAAATIVGIAKALVGSGLLSI